MSDTIFSIVFTFCIILINLTNSEGSAHLEKHVVTISGTNTLITSRNTNADQGTIFINNARGILNVNNGTVRNTAHPDNGGTNANARAITAVAGAAVNIVSPPAVVTPAYVP